MYTQGYKYKYDLTLKYDQVKKILLGQEASLETGKQLKNMGSKRTLIVTDPNVHKFGLLVFSLLNLLGLNLGRSYSFCLDSNI